MPEADQKAAAAAAPIFSPAIVDVTVGDDKLEGVNGIEIDFAMDNGNGYAFLPKSGGTYVPATGTALVITSDVVVRVSKSPYTDVYDKSVKAVRAALTEGVKVLPSAYVKNISISFRDTPKGRPLSIGFMGYIENVIPVVPTNADENDASKQTRTYTEYEIHFRVHDDASWNIIP